MNYMRRLKPAATRTIVSPPGDALRSFIFVLCAAAWMSLIFYLSSIPGEQLGPDTLVVNMIKKLGHLFIFGVLAVLYLYTLKGRNSLLETRMPIFALSFILVLLYAVTDEYHQSFTPGRHATVKDVVIDAAGAILCLGSLYRVKSGSYVRL
jgi:VanZ family protein